MKKQALSLLLVLVLLVTAVAVVGQAETAGAYMVAQDGTETQSTDPITDWTNGQYEYVKLYGAVTLEIPTGTEVYVDLNGQNLTVTGEGTLCAFNSANDGYTAAAGTVTNNGAVTVTADVTAPHNGYRYLALTTGNVTTMHRVEMRLKAVTLRTEQAGLYYKAIYNCDDTLAAAVKNYGVILSVNNMPGADFETETEDINKATSVNPDEDFGNGTVTTSGSVFNIMKTEQGSLTNYANANIKIYANAYIRLNTESVIVADTYNVGKTASSQDFDGIAYSLRDTLDSVDDNYYAYEKSDRATVEQFYTQWKGKGIRWATQKLGKQTAAIDNSNLTLVDGVGYCPVCKKDVTWTALTAADCGLTLSDGGHYYLAEEKVTMPRTTASGAILGPKVNQTACVHLNGKELYAEANTVFYGGHGILNVMGNGKVSSGRNQNGNGDAVHINNINGTVNLYGGDYVKETARGHILAAATGGGRINVYEGATIDGSSSYDSIRIGTSDNSSTSKVALYGVDLSEGSVKFDNGQAGPNKKLVLELVDAKVGTVRTYDCETVELRGEAVVDNLIMAEDTRLVVDQLASTASIGIQTPGGVFTKQTQYAAAVAEYFHPSNTYQKVTVRDDVLYCGKEFTSSAPIRENYCPACEKTVTWEPLTDAAISASRSISEGHYYLTDHFTHKEETSGIAGPGTGKTACLHLNGYNITSTKYYALFSGNGVFNVMGTGTVTGYKNTTGYGTAVQANNTIEGSTINLYSGTYQQAEGVHSNAYTISIQTAGGTIKIYEDAEVLSKVTGQAIRLRDTASAEKSGKIELLGAKVTGDITLDGSSVGVADASTMIIDNATVNGDVRVNGVNAFTLKRAPVIDCLYLSQETTLTLGKLTAGADITVRADGKFSTQHSWASVFASYFTPFNTSASVTAESGILVYRVDYSKPLVFAEGTTAFCPLCEKNVNWTALTANAGTMQTLSADGHYYLASSQTFTAADTAFVKAPDSGTACLHLNGSDITATNTKAISGNGGVLNVMGTGKVTGQTAVQTASAAENSAINLYSGTYTSSNQAAAVSVEDAGTVSIYKGAKVEKGSGNAIYLGKETATGNAELNLNSCVVTGNIVTEAAENVTGLALNTLDVTVNGTVEINVDNAATFEGKTVISQLNIAEGLLVNFVDMLEGSSVKVSATGVFTPKLDEADHYVPYFSTGDAGDWVICRDYYLTQTDKTAQLPATEADQTQLENLYTGRSPYYGDLHNHAKNNDNDYSDGNRVLADWVTHMEENRIDFAAILNHRQSVHMYQPEWDDACFVGASEPGTTFLDSKAEVPTMDYAMTFADIEKFEEHVKSFSEFAWESTALSGDPTKRFVSGKFAEARFTEMVKSVLSYGGFFTHVHPKLDGYMVSDDPEDYWFVDETGIEVATTAYGNMGAKNNVEAYELWVDLLERGHRLFATLGDDNHKLTDITSLNTVYASGEITPQKVVDNLRVGDLTAGPVGIRMSIGSTATGGLTSFDGKRLVFSVGAMHEPYYNMNKTHKYGIELYDDLGIIFSTEIDPTETTYFAMDVDTNRKFYRAVVVDLTDGVRIAVGNPIWNADLYVKQEKFPE